MVPLPFLSWTRRVPARDLQVWLTPPAGALASRADALFLLEAFTGLPRLRLLAEGLTLGVHRLWRVRRLLRRLWQGEPLAYLIGTQPFGDMELRVDPRVLIPRPETEDLSALVKAHVKPGMRVLDIGTGSGCLAIDLKRSVPGLHVEALDVSRGALAVARENAARILGVDHGIVFHRLDFTRESHWAGLGTWDLLVSNPPYVALSEIEEMDPSVRHHEPHRALFAGEDGLDFIRVLSRAVPRLLTCRGQLFLEVGHRHGGRAVEILTETGGFHYSIMADHRGVGRLIHGWK